VEQLTVMPALAPTPDSSRPKTKRALELPIGAAEFHSMYQKLEKIHMFFLPSISDQAAMKSGPLASPRK